VSVCVRVCESVCECECARARVRVCVCVVPNFIGANQSSQPSNLDSER
jgi:hypothetical protein